MSHRNCRPILAKWLALIAIIVVAGSAQAGKPAWVKERPRPPIQFAATDAVTERIETGSGRGRGAAKGAPQHEGIKRIHNVYPTPPYAGLLGKTLTRMARTDPLAPERANSKRPVEGHAHPVEHEDPSAPERADSKRQVRGSSTPAPLVISASNFGELAPQLWEIAAPIPKNGAAQPPEMGVAHSPKDPQSAPRRPVKAAIAVYDTIVVVSMGEWEEVLELQRPPAMNAPPDHEMVLRRAVKALPRELYASADRPEKLAWNAAAKRYEIVVNDTAVPLVAPDEQTRQERRSRIHVVVLRTPNRVHRPWS